MGRLAKTEFRKSNGVKSHFMIRAIKVGLVCIFLLLICLVIFTFGQSGRKQEPSKAPKPSGPIADPSRPGSSILTSTAKPSSPDEVDPSDVVRISSNLVPIPVSVVDS